MKIYCTCKFYFDGMTLSHVDCYFKVQDKFSANEISWNRAMDEVRTDRLMAKYGTDSLLVIIRDWPVSEKYKDKPELVASLEYLVCVVDISYLIM